MTFENRAWSYPAEAETITSPTFDLHEYLTKRNTKENFVVVEIGHGMSPVAVRLHNLKGQRAYVGVEAWLRDLSGDTRQVITNLNNHMKNENVAFIDQSLPGTVEKSDPDKMVIGSRTSYKGKYDPVTILPDNAADELYLSNVFGDPHVAMTEGATEKLLAEAARLIGGGGMIVVRETLTPQHANLSPELLEGAGLREVAHYTEAEGFTWNLLGRLYNGNSLYPGFYKFIAKA